jgi:hypothetical protein
VDKVSAKRKSATSFPPHSSQFSYIVASIIVILGTYCPSEVAKLGWHLQKL